MATATNGALPIIHAGSDIPLDLLVISDQIGSSATRVPEIVSQVKKHFIALLECISDFPGLREGVTWVIKNIGDSLMIQIACTSSTLPVLLARIIGAQERLRIDTISGPVKLRVLVIPLNKEGEDYIDGSRIIPADAPESKELNERFANRVRACNGSLTSWLDGDLFGPKINLAFRAANLSVEESVLIIEDSLTKYMREDYSDEPGSFPLTTQEGVTLRVGDRLAFSPIRGLDMLYPFGERNSQGWPGHLFLRTVALESAAKAKPYLEPLAEEQQKFKSFTRLVWRRDLPEHTRLQDIQDWLESIEQSQAGANYFRNLFIVEHEYEIRPGHPVFCPSETRSKRGNGQQANLRTGIIGVFAGPFETTYEKLRDLMIAKKARLRNNTGFEYPVSTIVHNQSEPNLRFLGDNASTPPWLVIMFWRWAPEFRGRSPDEGVKFARMVAECYSSKSLSLRRSGLVVGGEWDGYATLTLPEDVNGKSPAPKGMKGFADRVKAFIENDQQHVQVESLALYFCVDGVAAPARDVLTVRTVDKEIELQ
jgi:hypothetical protein